jgi:hypothetical protein
LRSYRVPDIQNMATPPAISATSVLSKSARTAWQSFDHECVVLDMPTRTLVGMNTVGGIVWDQLDGTRSLGDIAAHIAETYQQSKESVLQDVLRFATQLITRGFASGA